MLGTTTDGYLILDRETYAFRECGEGESPYIEFNDCKKYFGGALCYSVETNETDFEEPENTYYDLMHESYSSVVPKLNTAQEEEMLLSDEPTATSDKVVELPNSYEYIRRRAFGYNENGTCSAVASCIALNYIAAQNNMAVVPSNMISEQHDKGKPKGRDWVIINYPNANRNYRYMVDACGMGWASHAGGITSAIRQFAKKVIPTPYKYNLDVEWTALPKEATIKKNIDDGKPVLITTTIASDSAYNTHTMCVYGYRMKSGKCELLVHSGWYSHCETYVGNKCIQRKIWIPESDASIGYYFSYGNLLAGFNDIPPYTNWAHPGIYYVIDKKIMSGTTSTTFSPNQTMSRAMLVSTLYRMAGSPTVTYSNIYSDVPKTAWYANSVIWATNNNIVSGVGNGKFNPNGSITREQLVSILFRYATYKGYYTGKRADLSGYPDKSAVSNYAQTAMSWAVGESLISGVRKDGVDYLAPKDTATRAQVASVMMRFMQRYVK